MPSRAAREATSPINLARMAEAAPWGRLPRATPIRAHGCSHCRRLCTPPPPSPIPSADGSQARHIDPICPPWLMIAEFSLAARNGRLLARVTLKRP